ncbi:hypothetical protein CONLIGDRAFT_683902 [Coniochaeta ligniaria NRRL 30616]|uniref:Uncharacterized protein n=1 Tax=Coniochaeta ligniaria NRRL 30616 TaxID=1408157 RepID=A0A1J7IGV8_9PEZI|nr:hypothetical protein CONLIGDRAFT_683902 [Coniochaeta ligniaria NRRL 30616]
MALEEVYDKPTTPPLLLIWALSLAEVTLKLQQSHPAFPTTVWQYIQSTMSSPNLLLGLSPQPRASTNVVPESITCSTNSTPCFPSDTITPNIPPPEGQNHIPVDAISTSDCHSMTTSQYDVLIHEELERTRILNQSMHFHVESK